MTKTEKRAKLYQSMSDAFEDGANYMLKRVLKHLKATAGNYSVEVANTIENDIIDDIRKAMNE